MKFYKLCTDTVLSVGSLSSWCSTNSVPPLFVRSAVCHHDVLQTVYRHFSFCRQSVIMMFYEMFTATVLSVGSLWSWCSTNCVPTLFVRSAICYRDVLQTVDRHCSFGRQAVIMMYYKCVLPLFVRSVGSLLSWCSTNCVPLPFFRSAVCHRDVLQIVYHHCSFGRQSVIMMF